MAYKITYKNNYWTGTAKDIIKWATGHWVIKWGLDPAYNELMRQRQAAALEWLSRRRDRRPNVGV